MLFTGPTAGQQLRQNMKRGFRADDGDTSFYSLRVSGKLLALGAFNKLDENHAEVKSVHTVEAARGHGSLAGTGRATASAVLQQRPNHDTPAAAFSCRRS